MYLLATRLSSSEDGHCFQKVLKSILSLLIKDHPHHTVLYLLALKNGDRNDNGRQGDVTDRSGMFKSGVDMVSLWSDVTLVDYKSRILLFCYCPV
jgi:hypothetical protein